MIERTDIRADIHKWQARLSELDAEREAINLILRGLHGLLGEPMDGQARNGSTPAATDLPPAAVRQTKRAPRSASGQPSLRSAIRQVLTAAQPTAMHASEILRGVQALGLEVKGKDPEGIMDLTVYSLRRDHYPVEKVDKRTWVWLPDAAQPELPAVAAAQPEPTTVEEAHQ